MAEIVTARKQLPSTSGETRIRSVPVAQLVARAEFLVREAVILGSPRKSSNRPQRRRVRLISELDEIFVTARVDHVESVIRSFQEAKRSSRLRKVYDSAIRNSLQVKDVQLTRELIKISGMSGIELYEAFAKRYDLSVDGETAREPFSKVANLLGEIGVIAGLQRWEGREIIQDERTIKQLCILLGMPSKELSEILSLRRDTVNADNSSVTEVYELPEFGIRLAFNFSGPQRDYSSAHSEILSGQTELVVIPTRRKKRI